MTSKRTFQMQTRMWPSAWGALEFAIFPHAHCPQYAAPLGIRNRMPAWQWVMTGIRENVGDGYGLHAYCLGAIFGRLR